MSTYLKNIAGYKHNQLKSKSYDEIQEMFDKNMKRVNTFVDMNTELVKSSEIRTEGSSKRAGDELEFDNSKRLKIDEHVEAEKDDDLRNLKIQKMNIKFRGGLLGLKDSKMILKVTTAQLLLLVQKLVLLVYVNTARVNFQVVNTACAQLQLLSDYYCWKDYADRDEIKDLLENKNTYEDKY
ncbi:hypothetical protein Tco_1255252 [Tanacetum coccineum]